jgi:hypothetical protein
MPYLTLSTSSNSTKREAREREAEERRRERYEMNLETILIRSEISQPKSFMRSEHRALQSIKFPK